MSDVPTLALSVRQPWAWAIIHAGKDIENRTWQAVNHGLKRRGRVAIHASKGLGKEEYEEARHFIDASLRENLATIRCPAAIDLLRGGIIGSVDVTDVVTASDSPWFFGPRGLVLSGAAACTFIPSIGALGYFEWRPADQSIVPEPSKWMLPPEPKPVAAKVVAAKPGNTQGSLL